MLTAPVNCERALPLLIVIMLSAPVKLDHEFRIVPRTGILRNRTVLVSACLLPVFNLNRSCYVLPSIVGPGRRY